MPKQPSQIDVGFSETFYGVVKRLNFVTTQIAKYASAVNSDLRVLDIGCGTGNLLTVPIAKMFPSLQITGYDEDERSIAALKSSAIQFGLSNLQGIQSSALAEGPYDIVIASEVVEHVETPIKFLEWMSGLLRPGGLLILTLPNGYGWFEMDSTIYRVLELFGIVQFFRGVKGGCLQGLVQANKGTDTLALSLHLNFFSFAQIRAMLAAFGFRSPHVQGRTFLCGDITSRVLGRLANTRLFNLNNWLGSWLPKPLVSGWMLAVVADDADPIRITELKLKRPNLYARLKRRLNLAVSGKLLQEDALSSQ